MTVLMVLFMIYWDKKIICTGLLWLPGQISSTITSLTILKIDTWQHFADNIIKLISLGCISIQILLKFIIKGPINNRQTLVQIMAECHLSKKQLSEPTTALSSDKQVLT